MRRLPSRHVRAAIAAAAVAALLFPLLPTAPASADVDTSPVRVNQIGYLTGADKIATVVTGGSAGGLAGAPGHRRCRRRLRHHHRVRQ